MSSLLHKFIKQLLTEEDGRRAISAEFETLELAAKKRYEAAIADLEAWRANETKKAAFIAAAKAGGMNPTGDAARKKLKAKPEYNYDPKLAQKRESTLKAELEKAQEEYAEFNPEIKGYARKPKGGARSTVDKELPPTGKKSYMNVAEVKPLQWYAWPKAVAKSGKSYGAAGSKSGEEEGGVGPGEEWLAYVFGGQVQGGSVSYDVVTPDGRAWEVKALETRTTMIRPGTEGKKAFEEPRARLERIMKQLRSFSSAVDKIDAAPSATDGAVIDYLKSFVDDEYEMIVGKGEISRDRFIALRSALRAAKQLKEKHAAIAKPVDTTIGINKKNITVDKPTYIDVAQRVEKATGDREILTGLEAFEIALSALKDPAFADPSVFLDEWFDSIDVNNVFSQVDGVFIVNKKGFSMVPRALMKKAFRFEIVSQATPKFSYVYWGEGVK